MNRWYISGLYNEPLVHIFYTTWREVAVAVTFKKCYYISDYEPLDNDFSLQKYIEV